MLKFPPSWSIVELARLSFGLMGLDEYSLPPPSFCSSSHPRRALSGRTSMSGPNVCGFEHHSLSLARCQHSSGFCCHTQAFDQRELIRAFLPTRGSGLQTLRQCFHVPALSAGSGSPNGNAVREALCVADNEVDGSFQTPPPGGPPDCPVHAELSELLGDFRLGA